MHLIRYIYLFFCMTQISLYSMSLNNAVLEEELLKHSKIYIDYTRNSTIEEIQKKLFTSVETNSIGFGYAPNFNVWVKIVLFNPNDEKIKKIIEYTNPLTTTVKLYDAKTKKLLFTGGTSASCIVKSINPAFPVVLQPKEEKTYYLKASSYVTTLIVGLKLWNVDAFYQKEAKHQFMLALFFGAMGIIILYNFIIYLSVREKVYLYYVLGFSGIVFHHLFYKGIAGLYFFTPSETMSVVQYASFIVAVPAFFLALFTKNILKLQQYPKLNIFLHVYLVLFVGMTVISYIFELHTIRNLFSVLLLLILFFITFYTLIQHNRQAKFIMLGWVALMSSGVLMYLSSIGYYNIFETVPYYVEFSLLLETLLFSLILADRLKQLRLDKITSQNHLIRYQAEEAMRLNTLVEEKTSQLQTSVKEKDLLLQELNHRVKNSIQTIVSFLRLQIDETEDDKMQHALMHIENRIMSISHLYSLLYAKHNHSYINAYEYFTLLLENIQNTLHKEHVSIKLESNVELHSEIAIYCGFIINEAVTNALQHAFDTTQKGEIIITLEKKENINFLTITDNGKGFDATLVYDSLGLVIIESLTSYQLHGTLSINTQQGTQIEISWEDKYE